jgi:hypothetical protein
MRRLRQVLRQLVKRPGAGVKHGVACALGVSHDTAMGWSAGRTNPSPENRAALAAYARQRAAELEELARELEE